MRTTLRVGGKRADGHRERFKMQGPWTGVGVVVYCIHIVFLAVALNSNTGEAAIRGYLSESFDS